MACALQLAIYNSLRIGRKLSRLMLSLGSDAGETYLFSAKTHTRARGGVKRPGRPALRTKGSRPKSSWNCPCVRAVIPLGCENKLSIWRFHFCFLRPRANPAPFLFLGSAIFFFAFSSSICLFLCEKVCK